MKPDGEDPAWDAAWQWLCRRRRRMPANADIWDVWFH